MAAGCGLAGLLALALGWFKWPALPWQTWVAGGGFLLLGALDDRFSFQPRRKFGILLVFAALAAWPWASAAGAVTLGPWTFHLWGGVLFLVATTWFLALPNAINIEDAINGYMGGFTFILLAWLAWRGLPTALLLGAVAGFLVLNWPRAAHFMGDAGSLGCGFVLAEAILRGGGAARPLLAMAATAPVALDVAMGILRRRRLGMSPFAPDCSTLPHRVLDCCGGSALWASPVLWANALVLLLLAPRPILAGGYALVYSAVLVIFNWRYLRPGARRLSN